MYNLNQLDVNSAGYVIEGTLLIDDNVAKVLFDLGFTHSYLSPSFAKKLGMHASTLPFVLNVTTPIGKRVVYNFFYPKCNVK